MDAPSPASKFNELVADAEALLEDLERAREPEFDAVLEHVLAHPELRDFFATRFVEILQSPETGGELFAFCMHALRWPEVDSRAQKMAIEAENAGDRRRQFWLGSIRQCFHDSWSADGRSLYKRFGG